MNLTQELLLRILLAALCGGAIGYERKNRHKEAGIRTHILVAAGAALMMVVSKYGFADILGMKGIALDPSRIAAQIVSGVGFLGAGIIFVRNHIVNGLTTAAGIWVTSGIGMAIGSGLYIVGVVTAVGVVVVQVILHLPLHVFRSVEIIQVELWMKDRTLLQKIKETAHQHDLYIYSVELSNESDEYKAIIKVSSTFDEEKEAWLQWLESLQDITYLKY